MKYRNPTYNASDTIDCEIDHPEYGWIPFTAEPNDVEEHGRAIYAQIKADGNIAPYVPHVPKDEELAATIRAERDRLLAKFDWTQLPDARAAMGEAKAAEWDAHRQALRDIPEQPGFPHNVEWPVKPE